MSMTLNAAVLKKYMNDVFVETGSFDGRGAIFAVFAGFKKVITIEVDHGRAVEARKRIVGFPEITLHEGDSLDVFPKIIASLDIRATLFLDSHPIGYGDPTKGGRIRYPLVEELKALDKISKRKDHSIIIDDKNAFKAFGTSDEEVAALLLKVNPAYKISIEYNAGGLLDMIGAMI